MDEIHELKISLLKGESIEEYHKNCTIISNEETKKTTEILYITNFRFLFYTKEFQQLSLVDQLLKVPTKKKSQIYSKRTLFLYL